MSWTHIEALSMLVAAVLAAGYGPAHGSMPATPDPPTATAPDIAISGPSLPQAAGAVVVGTVLMPNGVAADLDRPVLRRLAHLVANEALALTGNVLPVGRNVAVRLTQQLANGTEFGQTVAETDDAGRFAIDLPASVGADICPRLLLSVGHDSTLTRALVYSTSEPVDIDFASEAAVRLIAARVASGTDLCSVSPADIRAIVTAIRALPGIVAGADAAEINSNATRIAASAPPIPGLIDALGPVVTTCDPTDPSACVPRSCVDGVCCETDGCSAPERCDISGSQGSCTPPSGVDAACRKNSDCEAGLLCTSRVTTIFPGPILSLRMSCTSALFPTPTPIPTPIPTPTSPVIVHVCRGSCPCCTGDCNADCVVTVDELLALADVALGTTAMSSCGDSDVNDDGRISIDEIVTAVHNALAGCPTPAPTP